MRRLIIATTALFLISPPLACAKTHGLLDFGLWLDAKFTSNNLKYTAYFHKTDNAIMLQLDPSNRYTEIPKISDFRQAAETLIAPLGCGIETVEAITVLGGTWEAHYICPEGVDLKAIAKTHRAELRQGLPLPTREALPPKTE